MSDFLPFPHLGATRESSFDISELIQEVCESLLDESDRQHVHLEADAPPYIMVNMNRDIVRQVLADLLRNALNVSPQGREVIVTAFEDAEGVEVEVADSATSVMENVEHYGPSLQLADQRLADLRQVLRSQGGEIYGQQCPDGGIAFTIRIPHRSDQADRVRRAA